MYEADGVGLAATQVDVHKRLVVIDVSEERNAPMVFVNPEITVLDQCTREVKEGCLSVPGFYEPVTRPEHVLVSAQDQHGKTFELQPDGLLAVCVQHEMDHLNGKLFVDYVSALKRQRIRSKLEKQQRQPA
jgi:peptide deformylase